MVVTLEKVSTFAIPRVSQLTQKTNQFNMTTKRYQDEDIRRFSEDKDIFMFSVKVEDKFGDNGLVGLAIVKKDKEIWLIDSFLLSCRVIARRVEETMLSYIFEEAVKEGVKTIIGSFISTHRNNPAKEFYKSNGFKLVEECEGSQKWQIGTEKKYNYPEIIKIIKGDVYEENPI